MRRIIYILLLFASLARADHYLTHDSYFLHVSFDVTRELFKEVNAEFSKEFGIKTKIRQSHGGSGKQTIAIIHGLQADIVSLALPFHMDLLAKEGIVDRKWRELFPNNSSPFSTSIVFLVKKDNPKDIKDWQDLVRRDVSVITANPKTSGGALWNYVSAWIYAIRKYDNDEKQMIQFMQNLYNNVPVLDSTARGAATTFLKRKLGDVLITWESEALSIIDNTNYEYEIIYPSIPIKVDIPVAVVVNSKKKHQELANKYIKFLFSSKGQEIIRKHHYNGYDSVLSNEMIKPEKYINWVEFKKVHFSENGIFEEIYK